MPETKLQEEARFLAMFEDFFRIPAATDFA
jgi:hypothetical protein